MSTSEIASKKLREVRERLPPEEHSPDLDDLLACFELQATARAELQQAARGEAAPPGRQWGANGAARNPALFRGLLHLLAAYVPCSAVPMAGGLNEEMLNLLMGSALQAGGG